MLYLWDEVLLGTNIDERKVITLPSLDLPSSHASARPSSQLSNTI